ncbi:hypothetical protein V8C44DRAFT_241573 [Trichoderma aethiopicum]
MDRWIAYSGSCQTPAAELWPHPSLDLDVGILQQRQLHSIPLQLQHQAVRDSLQAAVQPLRSLHESGTIPSINRFSVSRPKLGKAAHLPATFRTLLDSYRDQSTPTQVRSQSRRNLVALSHIVPAPSQRSLDWICCWPAIVRSTGAQRPQRVHIL